MTDVPTMSNVPPPPYDDGDDEPEFQPRPRRRAHALTFVLAGAGARRRGILRRRARAEARGPRRRPRARPATGLGAVLARSARGAADRARAAVPARAPARAAVGGSAASAAAAVAAVTGTVKLVDGKNVYVTDTSGNVVKVVTTSASSTLTKTDRRDHEGHRARRHRDRAGHPEQRRLLHGHLAHRSAPPPRSPAADRHCRRLGARRRDSHGWAE